MKNIKNKSINYKKNRADGLRICVMRHIKPKYDFDLWIPALAPKEKLLKDYVINKKISWEEFCKKFKKQTLTKNKILLKIILDLSKTMRITLLCGEKSYKKCHRRLIVDEIRKINNE